MRPTALLKRPLTSRHRGDHGKIHWENPWFYGKKWGKSTGLWEIMGNYGDYNLMISDDMAFTVA